ncbi:MAG: hypothetical protein ABIJ95_10635, partial [Pseudomonadota bacterium]
EEQVKAWVRVVHNAHGKKITARQVSQVVREMRTGALLKRVQTVKDKVAKPSKDEIISASCKKAVDKLTEAIQAEILQKWKYTSPHAVLKHLTDLQGAIHTYLKIKGVDTGKINGDSHDQHAS